MCGVGFRHPRPSLSSLVYDDLHRLTSLTRPAISQTTTFAYDAIGNLTANGENGGGAYDYGTRLPHAVKSANGKNYAYDANGNLLVRGTQRLAYDAENRLAYVVTTNAYSMFGYDAGGSRLWKQSSGTNGLQVWIGGNYEEKNGQILFHVSANGQIVCTFDQTGTNVFVYYHADHLHSTSIETDASGARTQHYEYRVFGQDRFTQSASAFPVSRRYTSQVLDEDTELYFYGARYYDPVLGRFIQPDSIIPDLGDPQSLNRYAYARNNPLKHNDPTGHSEDNVVKRVTAPAGDYGIQQVRPKVEIQSQQFFKNGTVSPYSSASIFDPKDVAATRYQRVVTWPNGDMQRTQITRTEVEQRQRLQAMADFITVLAALDTGGAALDFKAAGRIAADMGANFASDAKLLSHFEKHGFEFGVSSADDYLQIGRDIMQQGNKVQYIYKGETRTGFVDFMGNTQSGKAKFGFVGTDANGSITTIHTESGNSFWKMLNGNAADKTIRPVP